MRITSAAFISSACSFDDCPDWDLPEFAFIGRSNVGKSSMINLLANQHSLAKVSTTPGKTRQLNFFLFNKTWCLVDLPGYGFAKVSKADRLDFSELTGEYLKRRTLRQLFVLIDSRLPPQRMDVNCVSWVAAANIPFSLIFTKSDKQSAAKTDAGIALFLDTISPLLPACPEVLTSSAKSRAGRMEILGAIARHLGA